MGRTAGRHAAVAVAAVSACAALTCATLSAAAPAPARAERQDTEGIVRAAVNAALLADDPDVPGDRGDRGGPGLRVGLCVDVNVIVGLHAEVGIGGPGCPRHRPAPPPSPKPPPSPAPDRPAPAPRHAPHRVVAAPPGPSPSPRPTPRPSPSPSRSSSARVPAMRAIPPVRHRNPLGTLTVVVVLSVAIAAAGGVAFRR